MVIFKNDKNEFPYHPLFQSQHPNNRLRLETTTKENPDKLPMHNPSSPSSFLINLFFFFRTARGVLFCRPMQ